MVYPALYNGPINYYARLVREERIILEQHDHYAKQTYRNRFRIMGPNGIMTLSVPVKKRRGKKTLLRDILIDYDTPWNKIHWRSLMGAYAASPFFNLMKEEFFPFYQQQIRYLIDLNLGLIKTTLGLIGADIPVITSQEFMLSENSTDRDPWYHAKKKSGGNRSGIPST
ncbi:MAG: WbqC family protein [Bacteroidales bacterium]